MKKRFAAWPFILAALAPLAVWAAPADQDAAKAAQAKAKAAWTEKMSAYQLCQAQDEVAEKYRERMTASGKTAPQAVATPPCTDPGPFNFSNEQGTQPREGAGAHSPAETAQRPPSSAAPESADKPSAK